MNVRGRYCSAQEDWLGISVSYEEKQTQQAQQVGRLEVTL
jgi:hypothetical protein